MQSPTSRTFHSATTSMFNAFTSPNSSHAANTGGGSQRGSNRATPVRGSSNSTIRPVVAIEGSGYWTLKSRRGLEEEENKARVQKIPTAPAAAMHWSSVVTHGEKPRSTRAHTATVVGDLVIVFGGCDATSCFDDLYIFDTDTMCWSKPEVIGDIPPPCRAHSSQLVDQRLFIFGGGDGPNYFNTLYIFDTATLTWEKPTLKGDIPGPRRAHTTCIWDKHVYVFGGGDGIQALRDVYKLSTDSSLTWTKVETYGAVPIPRGYHTSNLIGNKLVVFGGSDGHECFSDIHVLDLETRNWIAVDVDCSIPRLAHTATQIGSYLFVIGGHDGSKYSQDVLLLNLVTMSWETRKVYGEIPSGRGYHTSVLVDSRVFVIGGYDGKTVHDSVYILDLSACAYLPQIAVFELGINPPS